ncbi:MAG TPA: hypothetical protein VG096_23530 [Bryobacteraceae bacterium]|nr:hypothetical protein [Bryobacteraceae bacterium]
MVLAVRAEASPQKRLALLDEWKAKYPATDQRRARNELYFSVYQSLGDSPHMLDMAQAMLADQPDNLVGLYWCTLLVPQAKDATPALLSTGEKAAHRLLDGLAVSFADNKKPSSLPDEEWKKQKSAVELQAHRALGWIAWQRANYPAAEQEFTTVLQQNPTAAEISAWFGIVLALEKQPEKQVPALWQMARAISVTGATALPAAQRREVDTALERLYIGYHGETEGLDQLRSRVAQSALPPADFTIESAAVIAARRQDEELKRTNPELAAWLGIRKRLEATDGESYFSSALQNSPLPKLKGSLLKASPARKPNELVLALRDAMSEEVTLKISPAFVNEAEPGTQLEFEGTAESYTRDPFRVTITVDQAKITGWPEPPARRR